MQNYHGSLSSTTNIQNTCTDILEKISVHSNKALSMAFEVILATLVLPSSITLVGGLFMIGATGAVMYCFSDMMDFILKFALKKGIIQDWESFATNHKLLIKSLDVLILFGSLFLTSIVMGQSWLSLGISLLVGSMLKDLSKLALCFMQGLIEVFIEHNTRNSEITVQQYRTN